MKRYIRTAIDNAGQLRQKMIIESGRERRSPPHGSAKRQRITLEGKMLCSSCKELKPIHEFYLHHNKTTGEHHYNARCHPCRKMWPILKALKLTEEEYRAIVERANGQCEICKEELTRPHVDHCHKTGKVRGVLCSRCNTGLGMFRESLDIFLMAITYLEKRA